MQHVVGAMTMRLLHAAFAQWLLALLDVDGCVCERVCVSVCVCERERERERVSVCDCVCVRVCLSV